MFEFGESDFRVEWWVGEGKTENVTIELLGHTNINGNGWVSHKVSGTPSKAFYINGVRYPSTRFAWLNKLIFKFRYWWQFTRHTKYMIGTESE